MFTLSQLGDRDLFSLCLPRSIISQLENHTLLAITCTLRKSLAPLHNLAMYLTERRCLAELSRRQSP